VILCDGDGDEKMLILTGTGTDGYGNSFCGDGWGWVQGSMGRLGTDLNFIGTDGDGDKCSSPRRALL